MTELRRYLGRIRQFERVDWAVYIGWVGTVAGFAVASSAFLWVGHRARAPLPSEAFLVPLGATVLMLAIAVDTIGHRTVYKQVLRGGEALVHHVIIALSLGSSVLLCAAYSRSRLYGLPALVLTALSFVYSLADEVMHWRRYLTQRSDVVEMWSHVFILVGHGTLMAAWCLWYAGGYRGVPETLAWLAAGERR